MSVARAVDRRRGAFLLTRPQALTLTSNRSWKERRMRTLLFIAALAVLPSAVPAQEGKATTKVEGTLVVSKDLPSFQGRVVEIRLYKHDPRIADKAADLVEKLELKDFAHTQGQETTKAFVVGAKGTLEAKQGYYVTLFLLDGGKRTHLGECEHSKNNLCRVLTDGQPAKIKLTVRAVR